MKGAEDITNKPYSFAVSTKTQTMYFVADSEKARCRVEATTCVRSHPAGLQLWHHHHHQSSGPAGAVVRTSHTRAC
jgi:hypothetical protein